jgi:hypothetical protein
MLHVTTLHALEIVRRRHHHPDPILSSRIELRSITIRQREIERAAALLMAKPSRVRNAGLDAFDQARRRRRDQEQEQEQARFRNDLFSDVVSQQVADAILDAAKNIAR